MNPTDKLKEELRATAAKLGQLPQPTPAIAAAREGLTPTNQEMALERLRETVAALREATPGTEYTASLFQLLDVQMELATHPHFLDTYHYAHLGRIYSGNSGRFPAYEPIFLFRARDRHALPSLACYLQICREDNCKANHLNGIKEHIARFQAFRQLHPDSMRQPGLNRG